jgi:hypothetical protein
MVKQNKTLDAATPLKGLGQARKSAGKKGLPPVHLWHPELCGDIDMRIARDGTWYYLGSPIGRKELVRLFSTVLRHDEDGVHYLVTPVEKCSVEVEDAPFLAVRMSVSGRGRDQVISFQTSVEDDVIVDGDHPLRFETEDGTDGLKPYVLVRARLEALVNRALFYDLVALGVVEPHKGQDWFGVWSSGTFWPMALASEIGV